MGSCHYPFFNVWINNDQHKLSANIESAYRLLRNYNDIEEREMNATRPRDRLYIS